MNYIKQILNEPSCMSTNYHNYALKFLKSKKLIFKNPIGCYAGLIYSVLNNKKEYGQLESLYTTQRITNNKTTNEFIKYFELLADSVYTEAILKYTICEINDSDDKILVSEFNIDKSFSIIYANMIFVRAFFEYFSMMETFFKLVDNRVHPGIALWLSQFYNSDLKKSFKPHSHLLFNTYRRTDLNKLKNNILTELKISISLKEIDANTVIGDKGVHSLFSTKTGSMPYNIFCLSNDNNFNSRLKYLVTYMKEKKCVDLSV